MSQNVGVIKPPVSADVLCSPAQQTISVMCASKPQDIWLYEWIFPANYSSGNQNMWAVPQSGTIRQYDYIL